MRTLVQSLDLWDLNAVWAKREKILTRVSETQDMPGTRYGGPWPVEWIQLFERWMATGSDSEPGHHLILATPQSAYTIQPIGGQKRRLTAQVTAPTSDCRTWFELQSLTANALEYTLYLEPTFPKPPPQPTVITALETFMTAGATQLIVNDANGRQELTLA